MIRPLRPSADSIAWALARAEGLGAGQGGFGYEEVGATADPAAMARLRHRYTIDDHRFVLGRGRARFEAAASALLAWRQFEIPWLSLCGREHGVHPGQVVATLTRAFGLWFLNPCRVVYCAPRSPSTNEVAFAYGTLAGHVARGEERFRVAFDPADESVSFEILAFSSPAHPTTRIGRPFLRRIQRRFATDAAAALARACREHASAPREGRA